MIGDNTFILLTLIVILLCILVYTIVVGYGKTKHLNAIKHQQQSIPQFSVDIHFDPFPQKVDISNQHDCNAENLRLCDINDATTLFGCKELVVRCHHFDKDTEYIRNNVSTTIPANKKPNEGYALAITVISDACNAYHGDLTLVALNTESREYMLICLCKNPGYIGNKDILGNCTTPFICNGQIDNINKPLAEINCACRNTEQSSRYADGVPVCKELLVHEANSRYQDWSHLVTWSSNRLLATTNFNPTITDNINSSVLLDPCRNAIDKPTEHIPNGHFDSILNTCNFTNYGYPISNGLLRFKDPNDTKQDLISNDAALSTSHYNYIRFSDNIAGKRRIYGLGLANLKQSIFNRDTPVTVIPPSGLLMGRNNQINITTKNQMIAPRCTALWPTYHCRMDEYYDHRQQNLPVPGHSEIPPTFLWNTDEWNTSEETFRYGVPFVLNAPSVNNERFLRMKNTKQYGVVWVLPNAYAPYNRNGILQFQDSDAFEIHKRVVT